MKTYSTEVTFITKGGELFAWSVFTPHATSEESSKEQASQHIENIGGTVTKIGKTTVNLNW